MLDEIPTYVHCVGSNYGLQYMRCEHCGSYCAETIPDELTIDEALSLIGEVAELKLKWNPD